MFGRDGEGGAAPGARDHLADGERPGGAEVPGTMRTDHPGDQHGVSSCEGSALGNGLYSSRYCILSAPGGARKKLPAGEFRPAVHGGASRAEKKIGGGEELLSGSGGGSA